MKFSGCATVDNYFHLWSLWAELGWCQETEKEPPCKSNSNNKIHHNVKIKLDVNAIKEQVMHLALSGYKILNDLF